MEEKKNYREELEKVERKYKRLRKSVLIVLLLIIIIFLVTTSYKFVILRKVADNNINVEVGDNYKIIRTTKDSVSTTFVKDGILKTVNKMSGAMTITNVLMNNTWHSFVEVKETPENDEIKTYYYERAQETNVVLNRTNLNEYFIMMYDEQMAEAKVSSWGILQAILAGGIEIKSTEYNGKDCYKVIHDSHYMIVDKDNFTAVNDNGVEIKLEKNVVTDEDIKMPDKNEYNKANY